MSSDARADASCATACSSTTSYGLCSITSRRSPFLTFLPSSKCFSSRNPFTRARIVTSLSVRVVPIGLTTLGTVSFRAMTTVTWGCFVPSCLFSLAVHPATPSKAIAEQHTHARSRSNLTANLGIVSPKWIMAVSVFWIARLLYRRLPREARAPSPAHSLRPRRPIVEPDGPFVLYLLRS